MLLRPRRKPRSSGSGAGYGPTRKPLEQVESTISKCYLLSLPPELRNEIYFYVLVPSAPLHISHIEKRNHTTSRLALLQTCRQVNNEASPIFYDSNVFEKRLNFYIRGLRDRHAIDIPRSSFSKMRHFRLVLNFKLPDPDIEQRNGWMLLASVERSRCVKTAISFTKLFMSHPGIQTLTLSNFESSSAFEALQKGDKPVEPNYRRIIRAEDYELWNLTRGKKQSKLKPSAEVPNTATVKYLGDLVDLTDIVGPEAQVKEIREPLLRLPLKKFCFEAVKWGWRLGDMHLSPHLPHDLHPSYDERWAQVPSWLLESAELGSSQFTPAASIFSK